MSPACRRGRVTNTRLPNSGRFSNHASRGCRAAAAPITITAGAFNPASSTAAANPDSGAATVRCRPVVAHCTAAAGVSAARPWSIRLPTTCASRAMPMYTTSVPGNRARRRPIEQAVGLARLLMARDEGDGTGIFPIRQRQPGVGRGAEGGRHARHDLEVHAGLGQRFGLLAAAAEEERIAALEPDHEPASRAASIMRRCRDAARSG